MFYCNTVQERIRAEKFSEFIENMYVGVLSAVLSASAKTSVRRRGFIATLDNMLLKRFDVN